MLKNYKTVLGEETYTYEEKRSRFIARVKPVEREEDALAFISTIRECAWDATHNCFAYSIQGDQVFQRYSDDGEPSGTAGLPMLEVIKRRQLTNVAVVVTRYFGGVLLGASGLVRAYTKATAGVLEAVEEINVKTCLEAEINIEYHLSGKLENMLLSNGYLLAGTNYSESVTFHVLFEKAQRPALEEKLNELTSGRALLKDAGLREVHTDTSGKVLIIR